jgi:hypothetical protein
MKMKIKKEKTMLQKGIRAAYKAVEGTHTKWYEMESNSN